MSDRLFSIKNKRFATKIDEQMEILPTTLQFAMNAKLSPHRFWPCHENWFIKTIQTIPHNLYVSFKLTFILLWMKDYPGLS